MPSIRKFNKKYALVFSEQVDDALTLQLERSFLGFSKLRRLLSIPASLLKAWNVDHDIGRGEALLVFAIFELVVQTLRHLPLAGIYAKGLDSVDDVLGVR